MKSLKNKARRGCCLLALFCLLLPLFSCMEKKPEGEYRFVDDLGRQVSLSKDDKVAACHASFADCWLLCGGTLAGVTADAVEEHGLEVGNARIIGSAKSVNVEELLASGATVALLSADLTAHKELEKTLEGVGVSCIYFRVDTFEDYARVMGHFTAVSGRADLYAQHVTAVEARIDALRAKIPAEEKRRVLLMRVYSSGIKAKSADNLAGLILKEYGVTNIADEYPSMLEDLGLEHIVATDPDVIFVLTMGSEEAAKSYLCAHIESNPAFADLRAVKSGAYVILPKDLFHYKPNERWDESYAYLAKILYPELFSENEA